ncbi:unnamed protein product [Urochloa decumbens]|uniref:Uncharacterized protein n=1 Tax=Urochloa decumbens TaxID=240449 RepID=A0ABC9GPQ7_9POAL
MDEPQPPPRPSVELAGAARDAELRLAVALSREEVLRRRRRRLLQLCSIYRAQFWALAEELPARHGEYWWEHGASPALDDEAPPPSLALLKANGARAGPPGNGGLQLYQPCAFPTRKSGMPNGEAICGNPVLRGITPLRCADHDPKSQELIVEALRNAGIDMPLTKGSEGCCAKLTCWLLFCYPP